MQVVQYYQETPRFRLLRLRNFRYPLLCLYNTGERQRVNMPYCRSVGRKMDLVQEAWQRHRAGQWVASRN